MYWSASHTRTQENNSNHHFPPKRYSPRRIVSLNEMVGYSFKWKFVPGSIKRAVAGSWNNKKKKKKKVIWVWLICAEPNFASPQFTIYYKIIKQIKDLPVSLTCRLLLYGWSLALLSTYHSRTCTVDFEHAHRIDLSSQCWAFVNLPIEDLHHYCFSKAIFNRSYTAGLTLLLTLYYAAS